MKNLLLIVTLSIVLASCGKRGGLSEADLNSGISFPEDYSEISEGMKYEGRWWLQFNDPELNSLMAELIKKNYSLASSYERIRALNKALAISETSKKPSLDTGVQAAERYSTNTAGERAWRDSYEISLKASYEADIWGRISAEAESDRLLAVAGKYDLETLYISLTAELADRYFIYKSLAQILKLQKEQLILREKQLSALQMMYSAGVGRLDSIYVKQAAVANLMEDITETKLSMKEAKAQIALMLAETDPADLKITDRYGLNIPYLPELIPSDITNQRPDIKSAYASVLKIDRDKAAAMANRYPKLSFSASTAYSGDELSTLIKPENFVANLIGNLTAPLFNAGRLKKQIERQEYLLAAEILDYYNTVTTALKEVSVSLSDNVQKEAALKLSMEKVQIEEKRLEIARIKYEMGINDYSDVLDNKISLLSGWLAEVRARRTLISSRIELIRAAGGSWAHEIVNNKLKVSQER